MAIRKINIAFVKDYCISIGYVCISNEYKNCNIKLDLICKNNHRCCISFSNLSHGKRCAHCSRVAKKSIEYVYEVCKKLGWECLDSEYKNCVEHMRFKCPAGHLNNKPFRQVEKGAGCKKCLKLAKPSIEEVQAYCEVIGFTCLAAEYKNAHTKIKLQCINKHIFYCSFDKIKKNRGCPHCSSSRCEKMIRFIIEELTGHKFNKIRPDFLKYKSSRNLELDMFNEHLNLAFEYQGPQHYNIVQVFKMTKDDVKSYQERDLFKKEKCKDFGINLICIDDVPYHNKYDPIQIFEYIVGILKFNNIMFSPKQLSAESIIKAGNT